MDQLAKRRTYTLNRIGEIQSRLAGPEKIARDKACVYVTGSFGRLEASPHSDLDLFILGKVDGIKNREGKEGRLLKRLDEICIKADLIELTRN